MKDFNKFESQYSWEYFNEHWGERFQKLQYVLYYLNLFSNRFGEIGVIFQSKRTIVQSQKDWLKQIDGIESQKERDFFKPYWVPIERDGQDCFIDLSDEKLPLFSINYFLPHENSPWFVSYYTLDIEEIMSSFADPNSDLYFYNNRNYDQMMEIVNKMCDEKN